MISNCKTNKETKSLNKFTCATTCDFIKSSDEHFQSGDHKDRKKLKYFKRCKKSCYYVKWKALISFGIVLWIVLCATEIFRFTKFRDFKVDEGVRDKLHKFPIEDNSRNNLSNIVNVTVATLFISLISIYIYIQRGVRNKIIRSCKKVHTILMNSIRKFYNQSFPTISIILLEFQRNSIKSLSNGYHKLSTLSKTLHDVTREHYLFKKFETFILESMIFKISDYHTKDSCDGINVTNDQQNANNEMEIEGSNSNFYCCENIVPSNVLGQENLNKGIVSSSLEFKRFLLNFQQAENSPKFSYYIKPCELHKR